MKYYNIEIMSQKSLETLFEVLQDIRTEYEMKGINPLYYVLGDFDSDERKYHMRVLRNLSNGGEVHINKLWFISASSFLQSIKVTINDSFFNFYKEVENKINTINNKKEINQVVSKEYKKWKDIILSFVGEQQIKITHKGIDKIITFEEFGFADTRSKQSQQIKPKKSWNLLQLFASQEGRYPLNSFSTTQKNIVKKQKQELVKILKIYFGIKETPISYNKNEDAYIANFKIMPLEEFRDDYRDKNIIDKI